MSQNNMSVSSSTLLFTLPLNCLYPIEDCFILNIKSHVIKSKPKNNKSKYTNIVSVQLLHKFAIRASDGPMKLLKVIKNPVSSHLPVGVKKITMSFSSKVVKTPRDLVPKDEPIVMVVGAMAHGKVEVDYSEDVISISNYPLSAALTCAKICSSFEEVWGVE